jgi:hypothetical protein
MRVPEDVSDGRRASPRKKGGGCGRVLCQERLDVLPRVRDDFAHREAVTRVTDCRLERAIELDGAEPREQLGPPVNDAGHAHRQLAPIGNRLQAAPLELVRRGRFRSPSACVQPVHLLRLGVVDERKQIPADAVHRRLDDGQDGCRGDRRVDGVPPLLENTQSGGRRQRLARRDQAVARQHDRAGRARIRGGPIAGTLLGVSSHHVHPEQNRSEDKD